MKGFHYAGFALLMALFVSACATQPTKMTKRGLLNYDKDGSVAVKGSKDADELYAPKAESVRLTGQWRWPLQNIEISSPYGDRGQKFHQGIDLRAPIGTHVYAASDGQVTYVGSKIRGYGRMIVLKHNDGYFTVYAHHSKNLVKLGRKVKGGDLIAYTGKSGHAHGPHLHFEIRRGTQSFDPEFAINESIRSYSSARSVASKDDEPTSSARTRRAQ